MIMRNLTIATATVALCGAAATAQPRVLISAAASTISTDCRFTDVQSRLQSTGFFSAVDIQNATASGTGTPTLAELLNYDVVLTWSNFNYASNVQMGDVLADYVDAGGAVVVATFANAAASTSLAGRWVTGGYELIIGGSGQTQGSVTTLGTVHQPGHPIMNGVSSFSGGQQSFRPTATVLAPGATSVADWSDGRVLVAVGDNPRRVDLGFYPPSADCSPGFWDPSTNGTQLLANAVLFAAEGGGGDPCYANCDQSTEAPVLNVADFGCFLTKFAAGDPYANCDNSTQAPVLNVADFGCFLTSFAAGCP